MNIQYLSISKKILPNLFYFSLLILGLNSAYSQKRKDYLVTIQTKFGDMNLILYDKTPLHKANFLKLTKDKFYDSTIFHRVIKNFMIQGGDPNSKNAKPNEKLGSGGPNYKVPAEIIPELFHTKGALAAARDNNPEKASSGSQFYIVQGKVWNKTDLDGQMKRSGRPFTDSQKNVYETLGGTPHLDGNYTVFGQLINGMAILDSIAAVKTAPGDRPMENVIIKVTAKEIRKKKILKKHWDKNIKFEFL
jgi:cyclophilin family peptidyl-prolyl cis-trans isomerase